MKPEKQIDGNHYEQLDPQPVEIMEKYRLTLHESMAFKYLARAEFKGEYLRDIDKARWWLRRAIQVRDTGLRAAFRRWLHDCTMPRRDEEIQEWTLQIDEDRIAYAIVALVDGDYESALDMLDEDDPDALACSAIWGEVGRKHCHLALASSNEPPHGSHHSKRSY